MKDRFNNGAEYLDDLGRYRSTEQALENPKKDNLIHFEEDSQGFVVLNKFGLAWGPFVSFNSGYAWAKSVCGPEEEFSIVSLRKP